MPTLTKNIPGRLKRRSDFLRLAKSGKKWVSPTVIVQMDEGQGAKENKGVRFGLTATKKLGNAVIRNRIRRRLRAAANIALLDAPIKDVVLIGRVETATCPFEVLLKDLRWCLRRLETNDAKPTA